jgi:hypothetical protein
LLFFLSIKIYCLTFCYCLSFFSIFPRISAFFVLRKLIGIATCILFLSEYIGVMESRENISNKGSSSESVPISLGLSLLIDLLF